MQRVDWIADCKGWIGREQPAPHATPTPAQQRSQVAAQMYGHPEAAPLNGHNVIDSTATIVADPIATPPTTTTEEIDPMPATPMPPHVRAQLATFLNRSAPQARLASAPRRHVPDQPIPEAPPPAIPTEREQAERARQLAAVARMTGAITAGTGA